MATFKTGGNDSPVPPAGRPSASGMSQGTYTGNVSFSRGNVDLIASPAKAVVPVTPQTPPPAPKPVANPAPAPTAPRYLSSVSF